MQTVRPPAVAGAFYPGSGESLALQVRAYLRAGAAALDEKTTPPKALVVPHAGYIYSGEVAALAYARLAPLRGSIQRVVLLGPAHRMPFRGLALPGVSAFATPLGDVPVDLAAADLLLDLPQVITSPAAHAHEHSLEVQLPFLQTVLGGFQLLPLAVGDATAEEVAQVLERVWGGPETLLVVSSDLSHYLPYAAARSADEATLRQLLSLQGGLSHRQACGATPLNGLLLAARRHHLRPRLLGQCNSGDTAGDRSRVVGYAALAFTEGDAHAH